VSFDQAAHSLDYEIPLSLIALSSLFGSDLTIQCQLSDRGGAPVPVPVTATRTLHFQPTGPQEKIHPVLIQATSYGAAAPTMADFQASLSGVCTCAVSHVL
jgi:hypothetical protein